MKYNDSICNVDETVIVGKTWYDAGKSEPILIRCRFGENSYRVNLTVLHM